MIGFVVIDGNVGRPGMRFGFIHRQTGPKFSQKSEDMKLDIGCGGKGTMYDGVKSTEHEG